MKACKHGLTLRMRESAITEIHMPKCKARNDSKGVSAVRRSSVSLDVSEMNNKSRGNKVRHEAREMSL